MNSSIFLFDTGEKMERKLKALNTIGRRQSAEVLSEPQRALASRKNTRAILCKISVQRINMLPTTIEEWVKAE